jgi:hypothetical protein
MDFEFRQRGTGLFDAFLKSSFGTVRLGTVAGRAGQWCAEPPRGRAVAGTFRTKAQAAEALQAVKFSSEVPA